MTPTMHEFLNLPSDVKEKVLEKVSPVTLCRLATTCSQLRNEATTVAAKRLLSDPRLALLRICKLDTQGHFGALQWLLPGALLTHQGIATARSPGPLARPPAGLNIPILTVDCQRPDGPYTRISQALQDIGSNRAVVFVKRGVYTEAIRLRDGVELIGEGRDQVTIEPDVEHRAAAVWCHGSCVVRGVTVKACDVAALPTQDRLMRRAIRASVAPAVSVSEDFLLGRPLLELAVVFEDCRVIGRRNGENLERARDRQHPTVSLVSVGIGVEGVRGYHNLTRRIILWRVEVSNVDIAVDVSRSWFFEGERNVEESCGANTRVDIHECQLEGVREGVHLHQDVVAVIAASTLTRSRNAGVSVGNDCSLDMRSCKVEECYRTGVHVHTHDEHPGSQPSNNVTTVALRQNTISRTYGTGVLVECGRKVSLTRNKILTGGLGVEVRGPGTRVEMKENHLEGGRSAGVLVSDNASATMSGDCLKDHALAGLEVKSRARASLERVQVLEGAGPGLYSHHHATLQAIECDILMNGRSGVEVAEAGTAHLSKNRIAHNAACIYLHKTAGHVYKKGNSTSCEYDGCFVCNKSVRK